MNYFEQLNSINCQDKVEKKNGLTYLSWPLAWAELKKLHPTSFYTIYENRDGLFYHTDGKTAWVKTGVTVDVDGTMIEHIEYLPVMDYRNRSIPIENITSFDVNKAIQRSLTKAVARHGLGLYIYAGEDLPDSGKNKSDNSGKDDDEVICTDCMQGIHPYIDKNGKRVSVDCIITRTKELYGTTLCAECASKRDKGWSPLMAMVD